MAKRSTFYFWLAVAMSTGCLGYGATGEELSGWHTETAVSGDVGPVFPSSSATSTLSYENRLTLRDAVSRTLAYNSSVRAAYHEIQARDGEAFQASRRPNPELLLEVENFGGSKDKRDFDVAEETASLTQLIELGGKRYARLQAAQLETSLATWDYEGIRVQMATLAAQSFVDVLTAQDRVKVLGEFVSIAEKTRKSVDARVRAGKALSLIHI